MTKLCPRRVRSRRPLTTTAPTRPFLASAASLRRPQLPPPRLRRQSLCALAALACAGPWAAVAQTTLPAVVIEATHPMPLAPAAVDPTQLRSLGAATSDTASLLRGVPGLSLQGAGGTSSLPAIHGLGGDRLRIKIDGMDLIASCPNHMNPPLSGLDPSAVGALEVWTAIAPVSAGGDSLGGTIVARTRDPQFASAGEAPRTSGELATFVRSNGHARGVNLSARHASQTWALSYGGALARADNLDAGAAFKPATLTDTGRAGRRLPLDEIASTGYETHNHQLGLAWRQEGQLLDLRLAMQKVPEQRYPNQRMDMLKNDQLRANLRWQGSFDWGTLEARVYGESVDHFMDFGADKRFWYGTLSEAGEPMQGEPCAPIRFRGDPEGTCAAGMPMSTDSRNHGLTLAAEHALAGNARLRTGVELQRYRLDDVWGASGGGMGPDEFINIADGRRDRLALYGEWEGQPAPRWTALIGLRVERVTSDAGEVHGYSALPTAPGQQLAEAAAFNARQRRRQDDNLDFSLMARWAVDAQLTLQAGVARKSRSPNLYERYVWSSWPMAATMNNFVGDGNGYVGNPDLKPEVAHTLSTTLDWRAADRSWQLALTPYLTRVSDYIDALARAGWRPGQFNVLDYANQSARLYGIDILARRELGDGDLGRWGLQGVLSSVEGKNRDTGDRLYQQMPLNVRLTLTHSHAGWNNALEAVVVRAKSRVSELRNEVATPGYGLLNLRVQRRWQHLRLDLGVENLFDKSHALPTGGTYVGQGRTMSMNGIPWGIAVPGPGRSVYASLTAMF